MTTPARPGSFSGATDTASAGSFFDTTLLSGIPDLVAQNVANAKTSETNAAASATTASTQATNATSSATVAQQFATNPHNTQFTYDSSNYFSALHYATEVSTQTSLATAAKSDAQKFATNPANSAFTVDGVSYFSALHYNASAANTLTQINTQVTTATTQATNSANSATASANSATASANSANTASGHATTASGHATTAQNYAIKVDGAIPSTSDYSAKAHAVGGTGVTSQTGAASEWAIKATAVDSSGEHSAKSYAISGTAISAGSAKQWAIGGGSGFARDTAVSGGEFSAKYYANLAANSVANFSQVYYGTYSSDSAAETAHTNAGFTVAAGDLYFSDSTNNVRFYNGTSWNNIAAVDTSAFASKGFATAMAIAL